MKLKATGGHAGDHGRPRKGTQARGDRGRPREATGGHGRPREATGGPLEAKDSSFRAQILTP